MVVTSPLSIELATDRLLTMVKAPMTAQQLSAEEFRDFNKVVDVAGILPDEVRGDVLKQITLDLLASLMAYKAAKPEHKFSANPSGSGEFGFRDLGAPDLTLNLGPPTTGRWNTAAPGAAGWAAWFAQVFPAAPAPVFALVYGVENLGVNNASRVRLQFATRIAVMDLWDLINRPDGRKYFGKGVFGGNGSTLTGRLQYHTNAASEYRLLGFYISNGDTLGVES